MKHGRLASEVPKGFFRAVFGVPRMRASVCSVVTLQYAFPLIEELKIHSPFQDRRSISLFHSEAISFSSSSGNEAALPTFGDSLITKEGIFRQKKLIAFYIHPVGRMWYNQGKNLRFVSVHVKGKA